jgi:hypothetical protein
MERLCQSRGSRNLLFNPTHAIDFQPIDQHSDYVHDFAHVAIEHSSHTPQFQLLQQASPQHFLGRSDIDDPVSRLRSLALAIRS